MDVDPLVDRLRTRRRELQLTQARVARAVGVNEGTLRRWELGHDGPPKLRVLDRWAAVPGLRLDWRLVVSGVSRDVVSRETDTCIRNGVSVSRETLSAAAAWVVLDVAA